MEEKPKPTKKDKVHKATKIALSGIPWIGGPAAELFNAMIAPPLDRRRDKWIESIYKGLKSLEEKVEEFSIENLKDNEMFITTVMHASQSAIRNHQQEKLESLRNAVLNAASPNPPDEDLQLMFLNWIDELTPWHLRILKFFDDPEVWGHKNKISYPSWTMGAPSTLLEHDFPELNGKRDFYDQIVKELYARGLINSDEQSIHMSMDTRGMFESRTSEIGKQFIKFITSPIEEEE